jgi:crotonobetainyl-CoA:carnitine CoA-transferase CaiB-like acyl-CoA transferase
MGGMFGVIAIQAALAERQRTGRGRYIQSALYENNVFLMAQAMMCEVVSGQPSIPYSIKDSPWPVYDLFDTRDGSKLFVTIVGEEQWEAFCRAFDRESWLADPRFATSNDRVDHRGWLIPEIAKIFKQWDKADLAARLEQLDLPYAPVNKPGDLFDDPHLNQSGGLTNIHLPDGGEAKTPLLPISMDGRRLPNRYDPPQIGEQTREILSEIGVSSSEIETLRKAGTIRIAPGPS